MDVGVEHRHVVGEVEPVVVVVRVVGALAHLVGSGDERENGRPPCGGVLGQDFRARPRQDVADAVRHGLARDGRGDGRVPLVVVRLDRELVGVVADLDPPGRVDVVGRHLGAGQLRPAPQRAVAGERHQDADGQRLLLTRSRACRRVGRRPASARRQHDGRRQRHQRHGKYDPHCLASAHDPLPGHATPHGSRRPGLTSSLAHLAAHWGGSMPATSGLRMSTISSASAIVVVHGGAMTMRLEPICRR